MHVIAMDTHCKETDYCVMTAAGRITQRGRCPTTIPALAEVIEAVRAPRHVVFEEGPLADWLLRNLQAHADKVVSCDPRRNALIAKDSDKDDPIDAAKLGELYRGGFVRPVHHSASAKQQLFKRHVVIYHDRVRNRTRLANRIIAESRHYGVLITQASLGDPEERGQWLRHLPRQRILQDDLRWLLEEYDLATAKVLQMRSRLVELAKAYEPIRRFVALPGVKWVRAATFFAYVDTPWRFQNKSALWKYLGIGLERRHSGAGPQLVQVPLSVRVCRPLKNMILSAAQTAIEESTNPFTDYHRRCLDAGMTPRNARRSVARSLASVLWGMWKNGSVYRPEWVGRAAVAPCGKPDEDRAVGSCVGGGVPRRTIGPGSRAGSL